MWMDWERSYFTMTDTNIEYIWGFLQECHRQGWLYTGHRPMVWCPRCGTSLSQHELIDSYRDLTHPSLYVYLPLGGRGRRGAGRLDDDAVDAARELRGGGQAGRRVRRRRGGPGAGLDRRGARRGGLRRRRTGSCAAWRAPSSSAGPYHGPFESLPAQAEVQPRVIAWDDVGVDEGTGIVHIAPGCGAEDFELGKREGLPVLVPVDEAGAFHEPYGWLHGRHTGDVTTAIVEDLGMRGRLLRAGEITHRFPDCWRCGHEIVFRAVLRSGSSRRGVWRSA